MVLCHSKEPEVAFMDASPAQISATTEGHELGSVPPDTILRSCPNMASSSLEAQKDFPKAMRARYSHCTLAWLGFPEVA
jgi:hypothetical protein